MPRKIKKPHLQKVLNLARMRNLFALKTGTKLDTKYEFWSLDTGLWVMSYYPFHFAAFGLLRVVRAMPTIFGLP